jgi:1,4-dihydroxy-2-naphthoyl-CoA hydrolase
VSDVPQPLVAFERSLDGCLGFEMTELTNDRATGHVAVTDRVKQAMGLVHGGVYAALAESIASTATFLAVTADGNVCVGLSNQTSFLRPVTEGTVYAEAHCRHRGRTTWVWDVEFTDDWKRSCALTRVTLAVRPGPDQSKG